MTGDFRSIQTAIKMDTIDHGREIRDPFEIPNYYGNANHVWSFLSTPVSYISSGAFTDPLVPEDQAVALRG